MLDCHVIPDDISCQSTTNANYSSLLQVIKAKWAELVRELGVLSYAVFHDGTLLDIHNRKPQTLDKIGLISGIGQAKLRKFGDAFLQVIEEIA